MSAITAKASRKMKKYAVLTREPRCFLGSFDFSWEQRKLEDYLTVSTEKNTGNIYGRSDVLSVSGDYGIVNQIEFQGRSFAGASVLNYGVVQTGDVVYTKSPLNSNPYGIIKTNKGKPGIVSTLYAVYHPKENTFSDFIQVYFEQHARMNNYMHPLVNKGAKNDMKVSSENALKGPVCFPSRVEQESISAFFSVLDNLITLHQRKCALLFSSFQALISMMFTTSTFSWEQRKFSDITFPAGEKNRDNLPLESYSITNEHGFVPQDEKFENGGTMREADKRMYYIVSPNSFAYNPARINVGSIGYQNIGKNVIVSSLYEVFKTSEDVDDRLLWHWFKSPDFQKLIMQLQEGGVRLYFYYDKLCMGEVSLPSLEEQRKIGKLFDTLDNLITLHQRKCISFTGRAGRLISTVNKKRITSSWEQRKAKELFISTADKGYPDLPVLSATQDRGMIRRDENSINIFHDKKNEAGYKRVLPGQFVIHLRSFQGGFAHSTIEGITSPAYTVFGFSEPEKHDSEYWKYVFTSKAFIRRLETVTYGIRDGRSISYDEFLTLGFAYPSKAEQTAIARYLDKLSDLITLHQRKPFLMKWRTSDANRNQTNRLVL